MALGKFTIQETALTGLGDYLNARQLLFVSQHLNRSGTGNGHKLLVVGPADIDLLFPLKIVAPKQGGSGFDVMLLNQGDCCHSHRLRSGHG